MAVSSITERGGRRWRGSNSRTSSNRTRVYLVKLDGVPTGPDEAMDADLGGGNAIPSLGDAHPDYATAVCSDISAELENDADRTLWVVTCEYTTSDSNNSSDDPTDDPWEISWGAQNTREIVANTKTATNATPPTGAKSKGVVAGAPIVNAAGDWFDPPIEEDRAILSLTLRKNKSSYDVNEAAEYINTCNDDAITIAGYTAAKWTARLVEYSGEERFDRGGYWRVTYRILITEKATKDGNEIGWQREVINQGYNWADGSDNRYPIVLTEGGELVKPWPLNDDGTYSETMATTDINYLIFGTILEKSFSTLSLPTSM